MKESHWIAVETALPEMKVTQQEAWACAQGRPGTDAKTQAWYKRFLNDPGIETRHFAMERLNQVYFETPDESHARFQKAAVKLGAEALLKSLRSAGIQPQDLDALVTTTCTGYLCPGLSSYIAEAVGLRADITAVDLAGTGCGAALPALRTADQFLKNNAESFAAVLCVEICSAAIDWGQEIDLILSNAIFADGAACAVLTNHPARKGLLQKGFDSLLWPEYREHLRFKTRNSRLSNVIHPEVPKVAARAVQTLAAKITAQPDRDFHAFAVHPGGRKVLDAVEQAVPAMRGRLEASRAVLKRCGNMSSPSVLFVMRELLDTGRVMLNEKTMLFAFGAGFTAFASAVEAVQLPSSLRAFKKEVLV